MFWLVFIVQLAACGVCCHLVGLAVRFGDVRQPALHVYQRLIMGCACLDIRAELVAASSKGGMVRLDQCTLAGADVLAGPYRVHASRVGLGKLAFLVGCQPADDLVGFWRAGLITPKSSFWGNSGFLGLAVSQGFR